MFLSVCCSDQLTSLYHHFGFKRFLMRGKGGGDTMIELSPAADRLGWYMGAAAMLTEVIVVTRSDQGHQTEFSEKTHLFLKKKH